MSLVDEITEEGERRMIRWAKAFRSEVWQEMYGDYRRVFSALRLREGAAVCPVDLPDGTSALFLFVGDDVVLAALGDFGPNGSLEKLKWRGPDLAMSVSPGTVRRALREPVN